MKRNGFTLIELLVVLSIVGGIAAILIPVFNRGPANARRASCQSNLKSIALGVAQYLQDSNDKFPPVSVARSGYWAGSLQPYIKYSQIFQCPEIPGRKTKTTDYFYNARLAAVEKQTMSAASQTVLLGDGSDDSPYNYALSELPAKWLQNEKSPARRHLDGANYAFADGHVKYLNPQKIKAGAPANDIFTFAVR
ncbi:hypothetical protein B1R32_10148 [Abditibacterium utsteinense]|uniref:DUF1559 domain-containing protein n=1 Tax=Abditibacterium utsteinense TaxID=1960156 RepID=A0A2S8SWZ0_9BACT|nr:prepilin-type N-terminal cleavage/methylation domain-containing protein [Abditibacterium utsteinense]PQV65310.1 hypothetical protein B1R32_10148 [Abditibacterium utsteinense]